MTPDEALGRLAGIAALPDNWDSYGAKAPTPYALDAARSLVRWLASLGLTDVPFTPVPTNRGGVLFEASHGGPDLEFGPRGSMEVDRE